MTSLDPIAFHLFGIPIYWYGVMIVLGVFCATMLALRRERQMQLPKDCVMDAILILLPAAFIGARLYYVIFQWDYFSTHPAQILNVRNGGLALYGGVIAGLATGCLFAARRKISPLAAMDLAAPCIAVGQAIGRWGNFFNQEAYGAAIANEALHFFPVGVFIEAEGGWFYATFFYESLWCALLTATLLLADRKKRFFRRGDCILWYALGYAAERVAVEGLRTDSLYLAGGIRASQLLSALLTLGALLVFLIRAREYRLLPCALPGLVLALAALGVISLPFVGVCAISLLHLIISIFAYHTIRKKAYQP